jgi:Protein of unknown function (DUF1688)
LHSLSSSPETAAALSLLSAQAIRERAQRMLAIGLDDKLPHFRVDLARLPEAVDLVLDITRKNYPSLTVPFHSRWRHFVVDGEDRWASIDQKADWPDAAARGRAAFDLAIVSVLLDAGAGTQWHYRDPATGNSIGRSEGLALASLTMFADGAFSSDPKSPLQADAEGLEHLSNKALASGFQVSPSNPLVGSEGRADLLSRLGALVASKPDVFGRKGAPRPGGLFDHFAALAIAGDISAPTILAELLRHLGPIWPSRLTLGGVPLGDCWHHPSLTTADSTNGLVPLHKLSQWLAYSLIEPLQWSGISVSDVNGLTGLSEYRNGGLFVDSRVLQLRDPADTTRAHEVASALVVEWRALTVALLDRLADDTRRRLGVDETALPLAKVLEGGTWAAGRVIARQLRADGSPPIKVISDGTVF